jgi:Amt family ammonium transporter
VFYGGGADLLVDQVVASVVTLVFSLVVTFIIAKALDATIGLRVSEENESIGLDQSQHAETAYNFGELGARIG